LYRKTVVANASHIEPGNQWPAPAAARFETNQGWHSKGNKE
jgi:hypothetical protein